MLTSLQESGYIHIKNSINPDKLSFIANNCIKSKVNYTCIKNFVETTLTSNVNELLTWDMVYTKFRVSNNNNSVDAAAIHRDINYQGGSPMDNISPCYTVLVYFDKTTMEIIPGSHKELHVSYSDAAANLKKIKRITVIPGDLFIFHSTLLHRGIFTEGLINRRLLQVFDVFPTKNDFILYSSKFLHVPGVESNANMMIKVSKIPGIIDYINMLGYLNTSTGYGYNCSNGKGVIAQLKLPNTFTHFSSEGLCNRITIEPNTLQDINKYVLNASVKEYIITFDGPICKYNWLCYNRQYTIYITITVIIFVIIIKIMHLAYVNRYKIYKKIKLV